ncbi:MAG: YraN family protein [Candidatus Zixiibacteriota bacterium]
MPSSKNPKPKNRRRIETGRRFERLAARFYTDNGFEIIARNWRAGRREIDLIVRKQDVIAFVEVKASVGKKFGHPIERVDKKKIAHMTDSARQYIISNDLSGVDFRFDVITFQSGKLEHYPNAFEVA